MSIPKDWDGLVGDADVVRDVFEHVPTLLLALDGPRLEFVAANAAYRAVLTKARIGASAWDVFPEVESQQICQMFLRVYETGEPFYASEWRVQIDLDGSGPQEVFFDMQVTPRHNTDGSIRGVQILGSDATDRVRARLAAGAQVAELSDHIARLQDPATVMQQALLPPSVPVLPGLDVAAEYLVAAEETAAGGDWFSAVPLPDGSVGLVVGDVVGHGVNAAAVMAQLRTAVRMRLLGGADLAATLADVEAFVPFVAGAKSATLCVVRVDMAAGNLQYCTAGHPPPLLVGADGTPRYLQPCGTGPLGTRTELVIRSEPFGVGDTVVLYSDGVVDGPGRSVAASTSQFAQLAADVVSGRVHPIPDDARPVDQLCSHTLELLLRDSGYADDVTMLAAQRRELTPELSVTLPARAPSVAAMRTQLRRWLGEVGADDADTLLVTHALNEYVENSVRHAYGDDTGEVHLDAALHPDGVVRATVTDSGRWKPPTQEPRLAGLHGLSMAAALVTECTVRHDDDGTTAALAHRLSRPARIITEPQLTTYPVPRRDPAAFQFDIAADGPHHLILVGDVDASTAPVVAAAIDARTRQGTMPVTIDLSAVTHLGSAAVAVLFDVARRGQRQGSDLKLIAPPGGAAHHVLSLVGLPIASHRKDLPRGWD